MKCRCLRFQQPLKTVRAQISISLIITHIMMSQWKKRQGVHPVSHTEQTKPFIFPRKTSLLANWSWSHQPSVVAWKRAQLRSQIKETNGLYCFCQPKIPLKMTHSCQTILHLLNIASHLICYSVSTLRRQKRDIYVRTNSLIQRHTNITNEPCSLSIRIIDKIGQKKYKILYLKIFFSTIMYIHTWSI